MDTNSTGQPAHSSTLVRGLEPILRDNNPWWRGDRQFGLPPMRRWAFAPVLNGLLSGLTPVTVLRGPRQVGKTTLLMQAVEELLAQGVSPNRIFRFNSTTCRS